MRDGDILGRFEMLADMVTTDVGNIQRGISMVRTRIDAQERLLFGSRFGIVKVVLLQLLSPKLLQRTLNRIHSEEIERYNENRRKTKERSEIKAAPNPGLLLVH
jgi:hypothetical protein